MTKQSKTFGTLIPLFWLRLSVLCCDWSKRYFRDFRLFGEFLKFILFKPFFNVGPFR